MHIAKMVNGIKHSIIFWGGEITWITLNASVKECPIVNAVTRTKSFFQSAIGKSTVRTVT